MTRNKGFREIGHTADAGIEAFADTIQQVFANTARGMLELIDVEAPAAAEEKNFEINAPDKEALLVDFLNEILFLLEDEEWVPGKINCSISGNSLKAHLEGSNYSDKGSPRAEIKAATYHNIEVEKKNGVWKTKVFFDL